MRRVLLAGALGAALAACGSTPVPAPPTPPPGMGVVSGGIHPCQGVVLSPSPGYAAGTVTVLRGTVTWRDLGNGSRQAVFPTAVAATATVGRNQTYRFVLPPGDYVLQAHFPPPANVMPFAPATVRAGTSQQFDIPNMCM